MQTGGNISPGGGSGGIQAGIPGVSSGGFSANPTPNDAPATGPFSASDIKTKPAEPATPTIGDFTTGQVFNPALPEGGKVDAVKIADTVDPRTQIAEGIGRIQAPAPVSTQLAGTATAQQPEKMQANLIEAETSSDKVNTALNAVQAAKVDPDDPRSKVTAAQQTKSSVGNLEAAQGNAVLMENPLQREIQDGELISGAADAAKAAKFTEQIQAAQATPTKQATVKGQLDELMQDFAGGQTPSWAAGAMRNANAAMAARGLGASSLAGQAIIQAAMESALPIAQADAQTTANFEAQNLSNRQQRSMLAAEQRAKFMGMEFDQQFQARVQNAAKISDVANQNFTAEQNIALENSRVANTMNLQNLSNNQALVMAEAAALSQLDISNLNNRQQAAVQNAQSFMERDLANLSNEQQTELFKGQQRIQSILTDQAAENAARQFNATSQNQTDQFFANLKSTVDQFNTAQINATEQFNAGQTNTIERFNAELNAQTDQFNASNQLVIAQSNATWRREISTADTAAINRANELNATSILDMSKQAYDNLWQHYADTMEWAWTSAEKELDRMNDLALAEISAKVQTDVAAAQKKSAAGKAIGSLIGSIGSAFIETQFGG
tara:strand:- start:1903 stop:3738 length:1836 start_codon:yes stop_codon:yes gene_type:complete